jgi:hypothetical protein
MIRKTLLGMIPTLILGFAALTLSAKQPSGIALERVKHTAVKNNGGTSSIHHHPKTDKSTSAHERAYYGYGGYRGYRGYHGYGGYRGYRSYYGYHSYRAYYDREE